VWALLRDFLGLSLLSVIPIDDGSQAMDMKISDGPLKARLLGQRENILKALATPSCPNLRFG